MTLGGTIVGAGVGIVVGAGIGAAAMYLLDPAQGKGRRESARGKITDASRKASERIGKTSHDLRVRAQKMVAGARRTTVTEERAGRTTMPRSSDSALNASRVEIGTS